MGVRGAEACFCLYPRWDSNPHDAQASTDFKSVASTNSATRARGALQIVQVTNLKRRVPIPTASDGVSDIRCSVKINAVSTRSILLMRLALMPTLPVRIVKSNADCFCLSPLFMMSPFSALRGALPIGCAALVVLLSSGCNVFDGLNSDPGTDTEALIQDAQAALADGRTGEAVDLMERAYEEAPEQTAVRLELANALLEHHDLDLLTMYAVSTFLTGSDDEDDAEQSASPASSSSACTPGAPEAADEPLAFRTADAFAPIDRRPDVVRRAHGLVDDIQPEENRTARIVGAATAMKGALQFYNETHRLNGTLARTESNGLRICTNSSATLQQLIPRVCEAADYWETAHAQMVPYTQGAFFADAVSELDEARQLLTDAASCSP